VRLYYLDWLRVIAILGVFLFHAVHPFDLSDWHIKNAEQSMAVSVVLGLLFPWGMPFFFLIAGTGSWFALRRRTAGQYVGEGPGGCCFPTSPAASCSGRSCSISNGGTSSGMDRGTAPSSISC